MKRKRKNRTQRIGGTRVKSTHGYRKTEFSSDRESLCNSVSLTRVYTYAYNTSTAGTIRTHAAAREHDDKSEVRPLVF